MVALKRFFLVATLLMAAGCGFRPLYNAPSEAYSGAVGEQLASIHVAPVANYSGMQFRQQLQRNLDSASAQQQEKKYTLTVALADNIRGFAVQPDATASYNRIRIWARYKLEDANSGELLTSGDLRSVQGHPVTRSQYATLSAEEDARHRALMRLSDTLPQRLAVWFRQSEATEKTEEKAAATTP